MKTQLGTLLLLVASTAAAASEVGRNWSDPVRERVLELLREFEGGWSALDGLGRSLAAEGAPAVPVLIELLADRALPGSDGAAGTPLGTQRQAAIELALAQVPLRSVCAGVDGFIRDDAEIGRRLAAIELLARVGDVEDLDRLAALAAAGDPRPASAACEAYADAVLSLLSRTPQARWTFCAGLGRLDPLLVPRAVDAVVRVGGADVFDVLSQGLARGVDDVVLLALARLSDRVNVSASEGARARVRATLANGSGTTAALASEVLLDLRDFEAVEGLIGAMGWVEPARRETLRRALRGLTRVDFGHASPLWAAWYRAERAWMAEGSAVDAEHLAEGSMHQAQAALESIASHTVFGAALVGLLEGGLWRAEATLAVATCAVLGDLDQPLALPALAEALRRPDPEVRAAAHAALERIAGIDLPDDPTLVHSRLTSLGYEL